MNASSAEQKLAMVERGLLGAGSGAFLAVIGTAALGYFDPEDRLRSASLPAALGAGLGGAFGICAGAWEIRGKAKYMLIGMVTGCIVGWAGGIVYGAVAAAREADDFMRQKAATVYANRGLHVGMPAGAVLGAVVGLGVGLIVARRAEGFPKSVGAAAPPHTASHK
jgi:hypothetical protein